jgi:hypothetical protein
MFRTFAAAVVGLVSAVSISLLAPAATSQPPEAKEPTVAATGNVASGADDSDRLFSEASPAPSSPGTAELGEPEVEDGECGAPAEAFQSSNEGAVPVIFDTDFGPDVDDVGALAVLHALADRGEAEILGVMISTHGDPESPRAIDAVNTYYGRPDIPIGLPDDNAPVFQSKYTEGLASTFENDQSTAADATTLYRQLLSEQPDGSVTIVSVGYKSNLDDLLLSEADEISPLNGAELVARKVKLWVAMAGQFPDSSENYAGAEWNLVKDLRASIVTMTLWPTPIVFSGFEVGDPIRTGGSLQTAVPEDNPVREAYLLFNGGEDRQSWDLTAVWYAVRGPTEFFGTCPGRIQINTDGSNVWDPAGTGHAYLVTKVAPVTVARALDDLLVAPPGAGALTADDLTVDRSKADTNDATS